MKLVDISENCYAHLMKDTVYLYVNNEFTETFYIDDIEAHDEPIPLITREMEYSQRPSLYNSLELL